MTDLAIGLGDLDACGRLNVGEEVGRVSARLHLHDLDAELGDFVAEAVGQRFDRELARAVDADEGERHAAEDRADVDDQAVVLLAHGGEHGAGDAKQPDHVRVEDRLRLVRGEGFGYAGRGDTGVVDEHIDLAGLGQHCLDARFDRRIVADVQLHRLDAELAQGLGGLAVLAFHTAHRGVDRVAGAAQGLRRVTPEAAAGAGDQDCLGHTRSPWE